MLFLTIMLLHGNNLLCTNMILCTNMYLYTNMFPCTNMLLSLNMQPSTSMELWQICYSVQMYFPSCWVSMSLVWSNHNGRMKGRQGCNHLQSSLSSYSVWNASQICSDKNIDSLIITSSAHTLYAHYKCTALHGRHLWSAFFRWIIKNAAERNVGQSVC